MKRILSMIAVLFSTIIFAQTTVTGSVTDENNNPIPGANVVADATTGTVADFDGNFSLSVDQMPPFSITVSSVGFDSVTLSVTASNLNFNVQLTESQNLLDEIVVSASRIAERLFESPVTIEKFDYKDIAQSTGADFYSSLEGLKGVQINSGGLFLQQVNTRGFSTIYNNGFVQLVDGMNNEAPGLGFSAGNLLGIHELDIQSAAYPEDGMPKDRYRAYHEERAKAGVALTMTAGSAAVSKDSPPVFNNILAYKDEVVPWIQNLTDGCHEHGCAVMIQLTHLGRRTTWNKGDWLPSVSSSKHREPAHRAFPKLIEDWDIERIITDFADAAERMKAGGMDGIELQVYGHLLDQFWSPLTMIWSDHTELIH